MTSQHRTHGLRVVPPTLEPDPVFLAMMADLGASSRSTIPRTARTAGLRMIAATATIVVIAAATWAAGAQTGMEAPPSPAGRPSLEEPSGLPSPGDVGTPQPDVSTSPGSPLSPGLPGSVSLSASGAQPQQGADPAAGRARAKRASRLVRAAKDGVPRGAASHGSGKYADLFGAPVDGDSVRKPLGAPGKALAGLGTVKAPAKAKAAKGQAGRKAGRPARKADGKGKGRSGHHAAHRGPGRRTGH